LSPIGEILVECLGSGQVDDEIELGRLFDGHVARIQPAQNFVDLVGGKMELV
jgi:polyribonucleotide nucleotidyltransferase